MSFWLAGCAVHVWVVATAAPINWTCVTDETGKSLRVSWRLAARRPQTLRRYHMRKLNSKPNQGAHLPGNLHTRGRKEGSSAVYECICASAWIRRNRCQSAVSDFPIGSGNAWSRRWNVVILEKDNELSQDGSISHRLPGSEMNLFSGHNSLHVFLLLVPRLRGPMVELSQFG